MKSVWEELVSRNPQSEEFKEPIGPAGDYLIQKDELPPPLRFDAGDALARDSFPLPSTEGREGYYRDNHLAYWMSGLRDANRLIEAYKARVPSPSDSSMPIRCLDFGGASGRVSRHLHFQYQLDEVWLTDINREHINFVTKIFQGRIRAVQQSHIPHLPFEDNYFDLICAFSVFTHIETFDDAWLLELRRVLRPGGLIYLTANIDNLDDVESSWPVYKGLRNHHEFKNYLQKQDRSYGRLVFRWLPDSPYSSHVFVSKDYVSTRWTPFFNSSEILKGHSPYQVGLTLIK